MPLTPGSDAIISEYEQRRGAYVRFAEALGGVLEDELRGTDIAVESVRFRAKEVESLRGKLERHPEYAQLDQVPDLCGARVVVYTIDDVHRASELVHARFHVHEEEAHGTEQAETFGYASRHFVVSPARATLPEYADFRSEIQVRTVLQHGWALISHRLDYKSQSEVPNEIRRRLFRVAALLETSDELLDEFGRVVGELRASYAGDVEGSGGTDLPLDIEALRAAWSTLPLDEIDHAAELAEFAPWAAPSEELVRSGLSLVLEEAEAAGLRSVGELEQAIRRLPTHAEALSRFAELMVERENHRPVAVPPFVVCVGLALESDAAFDVFAKSIYEWMGEPLREAKGD